MKVLIGAVLLLTSCQHHVAPRADAITPLATVGVSPYDFISPFVCRITSTDLTCITSMDVRFRRGQQETQYPRGSAIQFTNPQGTGTGQVFFGCAGKNQCGPGYYLFASSSVKVSPVSPARFWDGGSETLVPYGSLGIIEVSVENNAFTSIRNRWTGSTAGPQFIEGSGIAVACTDQACTISTK